MNFYATDPWAQLHNSHVRRQAYTLVRESIKVQPAKYRSQAKWSSGAHWIQISINNNRNIITPTVCVCVSVCPSKATFCDGMIIVFISLTKITVLIRTALVGNTVQSPKVTIPTVRPGDPGTVPAHEKVFAIESVAGVVACHRWLCLQLGKYLKRDSKKCCDNKAQQQR